MKEHNNICLSILIPAYNVEKTIGKALESCYKQNFNENYEIVIVDDGSTDKTLDAITECMSKTNISISVYHQDHSGISNALNYGLSLCNGEFILRMDADDYALEDRLSIQYSYIKSHPNVDLLCNNIVRYHNGEKLNTSEIVNKFITKKDLYDVGYNFIVHPTFCFSKALYNNVVDKFGYFYDGRYNGAEDYELILRLLDNNFSIYIDDKIVLHYNVNDKTYDYQKLQYHLCNKLNYKYDIYNLVNKHIGIYYIATGVYNKSFPDFLVSLNNFFPGVKKTIILLSDQLESYDNYYDELHDISITYKYLKHQPWPLITLFKMTTIYENKGNYDYVFYFNANSIILENNYCWFNPNKLILTCHKDWIGYERDATTFLPAYFDNPNSISYIGKTEYIYVQGAFFGGNAKLVYEMCEVVSEMVVEDLINNIIPKWHDETYLNKYAYIYDYFRNNKLVIDNLLISEIFHDKNNLVDISETQFILLKENVYNTEENNKANKLSKLIPPHYLQPLYNYDDIYEYKDKYPVRKELNININSDKSLICIYISNDLPEAKFNYLYNSILQLDKDEYDVLIYFDSRNLYRERFFELKESVEHKINLHIYCYDVLNLIKQIPHIDNMFNIYEHVSELYVNILYLLGFDFIENISPNKFKYLYIVNENQIESLFNNVNVLNMFNNYINSDLLDISKNIVKLNPDDFNHHEFIKMYNLFKYKNRYRHLMLYPNSIYRLSYRAFMFLHNINNVLKTEPYLYSLPTLLYNYNFSVSDKLKNK